VNQFQSCKSDPNSRKRFPAPYEKDKKEKNPANFQVAHQKPGKKPKEVTKGKSLNKKI